MIFNYLGQFDQPASAEARPASSPGIATEEAASKSATARILARPARESAGPSFSPHAERTHLLAINVSITGGRLHALFIHSESRHRRATIEAFAAGFIEALRRIIAHCLSPSAGGATPSDFQNASVTQDMIDMLAGFDPGAGGDDADAENGDEEDDLGQN